MDEAQFKARTKAAALAVVSLAESLPRTHTAAVIGKQLLRSGTSVGASYRAACRAKSTADLLAKLAIVEEEADETIYWLELLEESGTCTAAESAHLRREFHEITAMTVASMKTIRARTAPTPQSTAPKSRIQNLK